MALEPMKYDDIKTKKLTYSNLSSDGTNYYMNLSTQLKTDIGATEILAATLGNWGGGITNLQNPSIAISYIEATDALQCIFSPHPFTTGYMDVMVLYR